MAEPNCFQLKWYTSRFKTPLCRCWPARTGSEMSAFIACALLSGIPTSYSFAFLLATELFPSSPPCAAPHVCTIAYYNWVGWEHVDVARSSKPDKRYRMPSTWQRETLLTQRVPHVQGSKVPSPLLIFWIWLFDYVFQKISLRDIKISI